MGIKTVLKDLLYTKGNTNLDIARVSILFSILCFWGGVLTLVVDKGEFDPLAVGGGIAAIFTGAAGWLHFRQKQEGSDGPSDDQPGG